MAMMGPDYAMKAPQNLLMARDRDPHPTERADLHGKRLVCAIETDEGKRLAESLIKELTGGDTIRARRMRENFFQFSPTHKLILCSNHKPQVRGTDHGTWRRLRLVPFTARFWNPDVPPAPGETRSEHLRAVKGMKDQLLAEAPGILAWAVQGCIDWQANGMGCPEKVAAATSTYRQEENLLSRFIADRCEVHASNWVKASELFSAFRAWCQFVGVESPPSQRSFGLMMTEAGYGRNSNGTKYSGLSLVGSGIPE
jgi:putative DNA primase/helicase